MGLGNGKYDEGNKGSNFNFELRSLQLQGDVITAINALLVAGNCCPTDATEATLLQVLGALQNGQNFVQQLVIDTGGGPGCPGCIPGACPTYIEIQIWNGVSFDPPVYYDALGNIVVPCGPLEFVNPQYVLNNILATGLASEATLLSVEAELITLNAQFAPVVRTPSYIQAVAAGSVPAGARSVSVFNSGTTAGTWLGTSIAPGVQLSFSAGGENDTLAAFAYTATATATLQITTIV